MKSDEYLPLVRWGAYKTYSGPWTLGKHRFAISGPAVPAFWDRVLATMTACEGGRYGAVNCYDRCILSLGMVQFCEAALLFAVSKLLGYLAEEDNELLASYLSEMPVPCEFRKGDRGQWAFYYQGRQVVTKEAQRAIFLGGASGYKDGWTDERVDKAKRVVAVMSAIWQEEKFRKVQVRFTHEHIMGFVMKGSRDILFSRRYPTEGAAGALRAAFMSFAGNLPTVADEHFRKVEATKRFRNASAEDQLVLALQEMTFGPGIAIYPARYEAIRPVLEREWGLDLPDFATELKKFEQSIPEFAMFPDTAAIQRELIKQGYDLGPQGADGTYGPKTRAAVRQFEVDQGLPYPDGIPDGIFMERLGKLAVAPRPTKVLASPPPDEIPLIVEEERAEIQPVVVEAPLEKTPPATAAKGYQVAVVTTVGVTAAAAVAATSDASWMTVVTIVAVVVPIVAAAAVAILLAR